MYYWYLFKLALQLTASAAGLAAILCISSSPRGAVVGFAARCLGNIEHFEQGYPPVVQECSFSSGLCVCFHSESIGFAGALLQVFTRVGVVNFSQHHIDYTNSVKVFINNEVKLVSIRCPHDILLSGKTKKINFLGHLDEMWKPGIIAAKEYDNEKLAERIGNEKKLTQTSGDESGETGSLTESFQYTADDLDHWKCDYVVVGPLSNSLQCATVDVLLSRISDNLFKIALLLNCLS